uniref:Uncharacterized protein n=1 Tax=Pipistrellus kuhlii TaxID=59472 RepID=A0A7J7XUW5_PIPKU|nr:hypothetical protein mPipKuh1_010421 [Pipistrellus kuhlii]
METPCRRGWDAGSHSASSFIFRMGTMLTFLQDVRANHRQILNLFFFFFVKKIYFLDFVQRGRERDRELETSMRESHRSAASCTPPTGDMPTTKVHALDRNRTRDPSVPKPMLYPLSQTGFGRS